MIPSILYHQFGHCPKVQVLPLFDFQRSFSPHFVAYVSNWSCHEEGCFTFLVLEPDSRTRGNSQYIIPAPREQMDMKVGEYACWRPMELILNGKRPK